MNKKIMKPFIIVLLLMCGLKSFSQETYSAKTESIKKGTETMKEFLKLSEDQAAQFEKINLRFVSDLARIQKYKEESGTEKGGRMRKIFEYREATLKKILTEEQYKKYTAMVRAKQAEHDAKRLELVKQKPRG